MRKNLTGSTSVDVELKRPFAQINVGVTQADWAAAVSSGITMEKSSVLIKKAATSLNLVTGAASQPTEVSYTLAAIPAEDLKVDLNGDKNIDEDEIYKWLSMSYILVADESEDGSRKATLEGLEFVFQPQTGNSITLSNGLTNVPVQRNFRTNILGKLLTGDVEFNISVNPIYEDDYIYPSGSAQELVMAAANGGAVTLEEDVELTSALTVSAGKTLNVNLNGRKLTNSNVSATGTTAVFVVENGGKLNIEGNGTVDGGSGSASNLAIFAIAGSEVNITGGTFTVGKDVNGRDNSTIYTTGGIVNISGGTFTTTCDNKKYILNVGQTQGATGVINVTGGTFIGYNPEDGDDNLGGTFVAEGYSSVKINDEPETYKVVKDAVSATEAETTIGETNGIVVVSSSMTDVTWSAASKTKLVLKDGAKLSANESMTHTISSAKGLLTIEGNGTIESPDNNTVSNHYAIAVNRNGSVTINGNVTVKNKGGNVSDIDAPIYFLGGGGSSKKTVTINGGYFYAYNDANGQPNPCVFLNGSRYNGTCVLNIYGGVFDSETKSNNSLINVQDSQVAATYNKISIYGGIFVGFNPAEGDKGTNITTFVADGYESVETTYNGYTAWEVRKIGE